MKRVIAALSEVELEVLRSILQEAGVPAVIRHEALSGLPGGTQFDAELWVERDEDVPRACELFKAWLEPVAQAVETWSYPGCGQRLAAQFDSCWNCGAHRSAESELPECATEAQRRADTISSVLDDLLHQPHKPG